MAKGIGDELWRLKIHVGHPEWQQVAAAIALLKNTMFQIAASRAVNDFIEVIVLHASAC